MWSECPIHRHREYVSPSSDGGAVVGLAYVTDNDKEWKECVEFEIRLADSVIA